MYRIEELAAQCKRQGRKRAGWGDGTLQDVAGGIWRCCGGARMKVWNLLTFCYRQLLIVDQSGKDTGDDHEGCRQVDENNDAIRSTQVPPHDRTLLDKSNGTDSEIVTGPFQSPRWSVYIRGLLGVYWRFGEMVKRHGRSNLEGRTVDGAGLGEPGRGSGRLPMAWAAMGYRGVVLPDAVRVGWRGNL
ncbi:hypothetical protein LZ30DRAFT_73580 [Colletotrichum cereale]|nr:hypothetical protein LZ30DRAFT_73580 [Colletotrichum cereale]